MKTFVWWGWVNPENGEPGKELLVTRAKDIEEAKSKLRAAYREELDCEDDLEVDQVLSTMPHIIEEGDSLLLPLPNDDEDENGNTLGKATG